MDPHQQTDELKPISAPADPPTDTVTDELVSAGPPIAPSERVKLYSPAEWEAFIQEWATSLSSRYSHVYRIGGSGDQGRDIVACMEDSGSQGAWDNYQCKHYAGPLTPSAIWLELGKFCYYTFLGTFTLPNRYCFVAPQDVSVPLFKLLSSPDELRDGLIAAWDKYCLKAITATKTVPLSGGLREHVDRLDFSVFHCYPLLKIIAEHSRSKWHAFRFGGGLPPRPEPNAPPDYIDLSVESKYVRKLLDAYAEHLGVPVSCYGDLDTNDELHDHFVRSRIQFYYAESLRSFSRDHVTAGTFENLQDEVYSGVIDTVAEEHKHGYACVLATVKCAHSLALTANVLVKRMHLNDRGGICHQLANDGRVTWVRAS